MVGRSYLSSNESDEKRLIWVDVWYEQANPNNYGREEDRDMIELWAENLGAALLQSGYTGQYHYILDGFHPHVTVHVTREYLPWVADEVVENGLLLANVLEDDEETEVHDI